MSTVGTRQSPHEPAASASIERVDRCPTCRAFTYDVSGLSEEEVRRLVLATEGRVLTKLVARHDGRMMSVDCGHSRARPSVKERLGVVVVIGLVVFALLTAGAFLRRAVGHDSGRPPPDLDALAAAEVPEPIVIDPPAEPTRPVVEPAEPTQVSTRALAEVIGPSSHDLVGVVPRTTPSQLEVHFANVSAIGTDRLPPSEVVEALEARKLVLQQCYFEVLASEPRYRGSVEVTVHVDKAGRVTTTSVDGAVVVPPVKGGGRVLPPTPASVRQRVPPPLKGCIQQEASGLVPTSWKDRAVSFRAIFDGWQ